MLCDIEAPQTGGVRLLPLHFLESVMVIPGKYPRQTTGPCFRADQDGVSGPVSTLGDRFVGAGQR